LDDLIKYAKAHPGEVKIAGHSAGGTTEISSHQFQYVTGTKMNYIPFGVSKANASLLGGHGDVTFQKTAPMLSLVKAGKVKGLAVGGSTRTLPDVPTFRELGYKIDLPVWRGIAVKKGTSPEIVAYLQEAFKEAISDSTYEMIAKANDFWLKYLKTEEFNEFYKEEREAYRELFQAIGWGKKETKK
jgi:tripartite-type tricarboxylate transporter receptor subunit TctC